MLSLTNVRTYISSCTRSGKLKLNTIINLQPSEFTVEPRNANTIGTYRKCPDKRGVLISGCPHLGVPLYINVTCGTYFKGFVTLWSADVAVNELRSSERDQAICSSVKYQHRNADSVNSLPSHLVCFYELGSPSSLQCLMVHQRIIVVYLNL